jgi:glucose/arabinose dehydrogenase/PKD repeat protein
MLQLLTTTLRTLAITLGLSVGGVLGLQPPAHAITLPPNFSDVPFISGLSFPTAIAFASSTKVYIAEKSGRVRVWNNGTLQSAAFLDLSSEVNSYGDHGLLGIAVHPNFPTTPYVYLLYTYDPPGLAQDAAAARASRLLRVTADGATNYSTAVSGSGVVILGTNSVAANIGSTTSYTGPPSCENINGYIGFVPDCLADDYSSHSIGTVVFGQDGKLYVGVGDGSSYDYVDPRALRTLDVGSLNGKILRIDPLTGQGLADNPFYNGDPNSNQSKVYNLGLRNPFRFTISPNSGQPYIGDVGWNLWEEINTGRGVNFGWPCYEGSDTTSTQQSGYATSGGTATKCQQLYSQGLTAVQAPLVAWNHNGSGAAVVGGPFYTGSAYPTAYQGAYFYGDYNGLWVKYLTNQTTTSPSLTTLGSDTFTRSNSTDLGSNWDSGYPNRTALSLVSNAIRATTAGSEGKETFNAVTLPDDQWAQVTIANLSGTGWNSGGLALRAAPPPGTSHYLVMISNQTGYRTTIYGPNGLIATTDTAVWTSGDVLRFEVQGSTLRVYRNTALILTAFDSTVTSGNRAGVGIFAATNLNEIILDNFSEGSFGTGTTTITSPISNDFASGLSGGLVQLLTGPDTNLYYVLIGTGEVRSIRYTSGTNSPPSAVISASPTNGSAPLTVNFSGAGSADPNGDPLTYSWNFGDGATAGPSTTATTSHTYSSSGTFIATLTVSDGKGGTGTASTTITSGNTAPTTSILSPANNSLYAIGVGVSLTGQATDPQDGTLSGASLAWTFILHHNTHLHYDIYPTLYGTAVSFTPVDHGLNTYIEVCLTATDSGGLTNIRCINLLPQTVPLSFQTSPAGLSLTVDGVTQTTPFTLNAPLYSTAQVIAAATQSTAQGTYTFQSWNDGGSATHTITVGGAATYTATYALTAPASTTLTFQTNPTGLQLSVTTVQGTATAIAPFSVSVPQGSSVTIAAPSPQSNNKVFNWVWNSWSDGGAQSHTITAPSSPATYTATFTKVKK